MIKIIGREVCIPQSEKFIGFENDNGVEKRIFEICDKSLFNLFFKLDIKEANCSLELEKSVSDDGERLHLLWNIQNGILCHGQNLTVQLRAFNENLSLVWHSENVNFYVGKSIGEGAEYTDVQMSEFLRIEANVTAKAKQTEENCNAALELKNECHNAMNAALSSADRAASDKIDAEEFKNLAQESERTVRDIAESMSFWDTFQESGMRENYQGMDGGAGYVKANSFGGYEDKYIYPKYPLHPVMAYGMFHMCENLVVAPEVDFSQCTNMTAIFNTCPNLKKVGRVESYTAPGATYLFTKCPNLETVEYINLPNATNYLAAFNECENLKNIRFAKGSIRCTAGGKISFHHCPNLTVDTIDSIFEGLGEVSGFPIVQFDNYGNNIATYDSAKGVGAFQKLIDEATLKGWNVIPSLYA